MVQRPLLVCIAMMMFQLAGCQNTNQAVEVIIDDGWSFPHFLVGKWKAETHNWEFVLEADGTISSAVISFGRIRMKPGEVTKVPMKMGGKSVFEPGEWTVHWAGAERELTVVIRLKHFYAELGGGVLEGKSTDVLVGEVSDDGRVWLVDWTSFPGYIAHTAKYPDFDLSADPNYGVSKTLIFKRVTTQE